jgi:hypothetical protein
LVFEKSKQRIVRSCITAKTHRNRKEERLSPRRKQFSGPQSNRMRANDEYDVIKLKHTYRNTADVTYSRCAQNDKIISDNK